MTRDEGASPKTSLPPSTSAPPPGRPATAGPSRATGSVGPELTVPEGLIRSVLAVGPVPGQPPASRNEGPRGAPPAGHGRESWPSTSWLPVAEVTRTARLL